jgi:hypothetical protein
MDLSYNFWENMTYLLGGIVVAGIFAAISQVINIKMLAQQHTSLKVCMKKEDNVEPK